MKNLKVLYFVALLSLVISCKKDEGTIDYASMVVGTYSGTVSYNGAASSAASSTLSRVSERTVNLVIIIGTTSIPLDGIVVAASTNNAYSLSYVDSSGSFTGAMNGNKLDWTLTAGTDVIVFSGIK